jgi:hypothetical protein
MSKGQYDYNETNMQAITNIPKLRRNVIKIGIHKKPTKEMITLESFKVDSRNVGRNFNKNLYSFDKMTARDNSGLITKVNNPTFAAYNPKYDTITVYNKKSI